MFDKTLINPHPTLSIFSNFKELEGFISKSPTVFLQKEYISAVEEAAIPGVEFRYIPFISNGKFKGFYYFQIINLSSQELGQIVHFEPYNSLLSGISLLLQNLLFGVKKDKPHYLIVSGNMCLSGDYGISTEDKTDLSIYLHFTEVLASLKRELERTGKVVADIIKDYPAAADPFNHVLKQQRYHYLAMEPIMKMEIRKNWKSMSDYVDALSSKYRQRFNQAKKKLENCEIKSLDTNYIIQNKIRMNEIYNAVQEKSPVRIIKPDINYIISLSKHLNQQIKVLGIFHDNKLIAFLVGIKDHDHFEAHHIGIDYQLNKEYSIYLNILYLYIEMAIEANTSQLSFGRTALEMKTTVGAIPHLYHAYIKLNNRLLNSAVKKLLPDTISENWIPRDPFRR